MESTVRFPAAASSGAVTIGLAVTGTVIAASMGLYVFGLGDWMFTALLAWPGAFLIQSFGVLSLYIPLLLGALAWINTAPVLKPALLVPLGISVVPFLTLAALVQVLDPLSTSPVALGLAEVMGPASPVFLGLLTVLEVLIGAVATLAATKPAVETQTHFEDVEPSVFTAPSEPEVAEEPVNSAYENLKAATQSEATVPAEATADVLRVPHIQEWNTARALRDDPYFITADESEFRSPALEALTRTLAGMPVEDEAEAIAAIFDREVDTYAEEVSVVDWDTLVARPDQEEDLDEIYEEMEEELEMEMADQAAVEEAIHVLAQPSALIRPLEGGNFPVKTIHVRPEAPRPAEVEPTSLLSRAQAVHTPVASSSPEDDSQEGDALDSVEPSVEPGHWAQRPKFKGWHVPVEGILTAYKAGDFSEIDEATKRAGHILQMTLKEFNIEAQVTGIRKGPVVTMFELLPAAGVKLSKIVALADNIALGLAATSIRIVAPIPGKHAVGIEVPNRERTMVGFAEMINSREYQDSQAHIPIVVGKDISGDAQIIDLTRTPHLLIAGATGAGKSVCVNTLVCSILYRRSPDEVKLIMIDPKIVELKFFNDIPHLLTPVITDPKKALQAIQWCLYEMERRYALLDAIGAKDIRSYNSKIEKRHIATVRLPYIVLVIDEFADLMATSGKDLEGTIARLAAMSRAVGIHLVLATQRPSVDVITGLIKANFPSRIAFQVASKTDSRIIIDQMGAEKLLGRGDMLFTSSWNPFPSRVQGAFLSEDDVERVVAHVKTLGEPEYISDEIFFDEEEEEALDTEASGDEMDPLFEKGVEIVRTFKKASASFLQRRLGVGYNRAARMIELMEEMGIVGPQNGSKPREIVHG